MGLQRKLLPTTAVTLDVPTPSITFLLYITKHTISNHFCNKQLPSAHISVLFTNTQPVCNSYRLPLQTKPNLKVNSFSLFIPQGSTKTTQVQAYLHTVTLIWHSWSIRIWISRGVTWTDHSWTCCKH